MSDGSRHIPRSWDGTFQDRIMDIRLRREPCNPPGVQFGCELFCNYFLQVIFIACIMVGFALAVAGGVLNGQDHSEYVVFVYIGILLGGVSAGLLIIHCRVRKKNKRRQRTIQRHAVNACQVSEYDVLQYPLTILPRSSNQRCPHGCIQQDAPPEEPFLYRNAPHTISGVDCRSGDVVPPHYDDLWTSKYNPRLQYQEDIL